MILTYTGRYIDPFLLRLEDISIRDIAHALSMTCRWGGHTKRFYSVAEHSVMLTHFAVSTASPSRYTSTVASHCAAEELLRLQRYLLLHDASEAYLTDVPSPYKAQPEFAAFVAFEERVQRMIEEKFGVVASDYIQRKAKALDVGILGNEALHLLGPEHLTLHPKLPAPLPDGWTQYVTAPEKPWGWTPEHAEANFLAQFTKLFNPHSL